MAFSGSGFSNDSRADGMRVHTYTSTDARATVIASGYFDTVDQYLNAGDKIECYDSTNGINFAIRVLAVTSGVVTTSDLSSPVETVAATNVITASETGKTFFLALAGGFTSTLPAPAIGLKFKFIVAVAPTTAYIIATNGGADIMIGGINELEVDTADDGPYDNNADTLNFVANTAVVGDFVEFISDGTSWYYYGQTNADGAITTSTT